MNRLYDTPVLFDYLLGDKRAREAIDTGKHRAISVVSWLEVMSVAPAGTEEATMLFMLTFERLATSEAVADEAARLSISNPALPFHRAIAWATARVNRYVLVTTDATGMPRKADGVEVPYRRAVARLGR